MVILPIHLKVFDSIVTQCRQRFSDVVVYNTICDATSIRQREAETLAKDADVMIVVGGRHSSNTSKLVKICQKQGTETHLIEEMEELEPFWFQGKRKIGITGGASTPQDYVDAVGEKVASIIGDT